MTTITRERLQEVIDGDILFTDEQRELARIALASLEAEPVCVIDQANLDYLKSGSDADVWPASRTEMGDVLLYRAAPPAPVSVPDDVLKGLLPDAEKAEFWFEHNGKILFEGVKFNNAVFDACRAAMLQGADGTLTNEGTIPVTQFKPVADLYGLTSPTGGETSFTFDAVEARDFIDGGWLCQEYVTLERYQEAITNHTEDKLAMVDHSGDSNNMVEPVTTAYKLRDAVETIRSSGIAIDADKIFAERDVLNSPVIPDGWVACSERMPEDDDFVYIWPRPDFGVELHVAQYGKFDKRDAGWYAQVYEQNYGIEYYPVRVTHWMPLPAAPQQEV
ncbi:DUF551 domain-containing protein [Enterobacter hormaechei]|uniref:DUF551 domain-containing protein n=1 Tax=Enterobacter hormaechei TaxID=158836 RepID=UPI000B10145A|nr:DUF551 domain-containing protein [Enterobacter hormaechei]